MYIISLFLCIKAWGYLFLWDIQKKINEFQFGICNAVLANKHHLKISVKNQTVYDMNVSVFFLSWEQRNKH